MLIRSRRPKLNVRGNVISIDSEATGLLPWGKDRRVVYNFGTTKAPDIEVRRVVPARPFVWSLCDQDGNTDYIRGQVHPKTRAVTWLDDAKHAAVADIWANPEITKVGHNLRFDISMAQHDGMTVRGTVVDTQILAHVASSGQELTYALKQLCKKWFQYPDDDEKNLLQHVVKMRTIAKKKRHSFAVKELAGKEPKKADMWMADDALLRAYAVGDVIRATLIYMAWWDKIQQNARLKEVCDREHELFWVLKDMEDTGVRVSRPRVNSLIQFYNAYRAKQTTIAEAHGGKGLNYKSPKQMTEVFYERRRHLPMYTKTFNKKLGRNNYSLNGDAVLKMATGYVIQSAEWEELNRTDDRLPLGAKWYTKKETFDASGFTTTGRYIKVPPDPLAKAVMEYNAAGQTISAFLRVYKRFWVKESPGVWILHPGFKQTGAKTGRLSCSDPNLQQVASETTGRRKADIQSRPREAFGPRPGAMWYLPDYSQIEVWLFAFLSGEKAMQKALLSGEDYHSGIAKRVFGERGDFTDAKDYYRKCAKLIMFCLLYGGGVPKAATLLKSDIDTAQEFVTQYHASLPGVKKFMDALIHEAKTKGEIYSPFGRRYTFDADFAYRAVNYLIQGTAADVMKNGLINTWKMLKRKGWWKLGVRILVTVHDEMILEIPTHLHSIELMTDVIHAMQEDSTRLGLPVRLPVEMKIAKTRWSRPTKIELPRSIVGGAPYSKSA